MHVRTHPVLELLLSSELNIVHVYSSARLGKSLFLYSQTMLRSDWAIQFVLLTQKKKGTRRASLKVVIQWWLGGMLQNGRVLYFLITAPVSIFKCYSRLP